MRRRFSGSSSDNGPAFGDRHTQGLKVCNILPWGATDQNFTLLCVQSPPGLLLPITHHCSAPLGLPEQTLRQFLVQRLCEEQNLPAGTHRAHPAAATHRAVGRLWLWKVPVQLWHSSKHLSGCSPAAWQPKQSSDDDYPCSQTAAASSFGPGSSP